MDTLAAFKSRSDAIKLYKTLRDGKIICATVATPSYLKLGCGLSVVFPNGFVDRVKEIVRYYRLDSFVGFFARR